jgi:hypothetical protein
MAEFALFTHSAKVVSCEDCGHGIMQPPPFPRPPPPTPSTRPPPSLPAFCLFADCRHLESNFEQIGTNETCQN